MGIHADDLMEQEEMRALEFEEEMTYLMSNEEQLRKDTSRSRDAKIMSIRKWPHHLSGKQKWCLAYWIMRNNYER